MKPNKKLHVVKKKPCHRHSTLAAPPSPPPFHHLTHIHWKWHYNFSYWLVCIYFYYVHQHLTIETSRFHPPVHLVQSHPTFWWFLLRAAHRVYQPLSSKCAYLFCITLPKLSHIPAPQPPWPSLRHLSHFLFVLCALPRHWRWCFFFIMQLS